MIYIISVILNPDELLLVTVNYVKLGNRIIDWGHSKLIYFSLSKWSFILLSSLIVDLSNHHLSRKLFS